MVRGTGIAGVRGPGLNTSDCPYPCFVFARSSFVAPLTSAILGAIEPERSGIASAINNAIARVAGLVVIAMLAGILGGSLDLDGFHRAAIVTAALMVIGGLISFFGIQNPPRTQGEPTVDAAAPPAAAA